MAFGIDKGHMRGIRHTACAGRSEYQMLWAGLSGVEGACRQSRGIGRFGDRVIAILSLHTCVLVLWAP